MDLGQAQHKVKHFACCHISFDFLIDPFAFSFHNGYNDISYPGADFVPGYRSFSFDHPKTGVPVDSDRYYLHSLPRRFPLQAEEIGGGSAAPRRVCPDMSNDWWTHKHHDACQEEGGKDHHCRDVGADVQQARKPRAEHLDCEEIQQGRPHAPNDTGQNRGGAPGAEGLQLGCGGP